MIFTKPGKHFKKPENKSEIKGKESYIKSAGFFTKDVNVDYTLASFLEPLEYFALIIAAKEIDN